MAPQKQTPAAVTTTPAPKPAPEEYTFEVGEYGAGKHRAAAQIPDRVADLLENLRDVHGVEVRDAKGNVIPAGTVKFKTVTLAHEQAGDAFLKHVRSYSKNVMFPEWSARVSRLSPTTFRVGVGPVRPKPRRAKKADTETAQES